MKCGDKSVKLKQFLRQINFGESQWVADETNLEVVETELASFHHISTPVVFNTKPPEQVLTLIFALESLNEKLIFGFNLPPQTRRKKSTNI